MRRRALDRARLRAENAQNILEEIKILPPKVPGFESLWYDFLVNFNNAFSQLEQGSKVSQRSKDWFSEVKKFRKNDDLLRYLQHARNIEEHSDLGSVFRTKFVLKPMIKGGSVQYRDDKGRRLAKPHLSLQKGTGDQLFKIKLPGVSFRTVIDRGKTYRFPKQYTHGVLDRLLEDGEVSLDNEQLNVLGLARVAVEHLRLVIHDAEKFIE